MSLEGTNKAGPKIRLLVAEDSLNTRHNLTSVLEYEPQVEVVGAVGTIAQALKIAAQLEPQVILMDINLPDGDGLSATREILNILPSAVVIVMSVQDELAYQRRALAAGAKAFLVKPFAIEELMAAIYSATENRLNSKD